MRFLLNQTDPRALFDAHGHLLFFAGVDALKDRTLGDCLRALRHIVPTVRGETLASLMEYARPDDLFGWVSPLQILDDWVIAQHFLGPRRDLWLLIVERLRRRYDGIPLPNASEEVSPRRQAALDRAAKRLGERLVEIRRTERAIFLAPLWPDLERGAPLAKALTHARSLEPNLSVFELADILIRRDFSVVAPTLGLDEAALERWFERKAKLIVGILDCVLREVLVLH